MQFFVKALQALPHLFLNPLSALRVGVFLHLPVTRSGCVKYATDMVF